MRKSLYDFCIERDEFDLLVQWDNGKNQALTPKDVSYGTKTKVWWACAFGHQWQTAVYSRTGYGSGCPYCSGKKRLPSSPTLASEYPRLVAEWHPTKNANLRPEDMPPSTHRKVWWICSKGHEWSAEVSSRTKGTGCPICTNRIVVKGENDLATTHPEIASQWHPKLNGALTPQDVVAGRHKKVWWQCEHGHEWQALIVARAANRNRCPVCAGKTLVKGVNDLASRFPRLATEWHPTRNGQRKPDEVAAFSNTRAWWLCDKGHEFECTIGHRAQSSTNCPYCTNRKVLTGFNDLLTLEPEIAAQWHPELNGAFTPQMVTAGSRKKVWWQCSNGHVWKSVIYSRTGGRRTGCPICAGTIRNVRTK